ncbi:hypothetical protein L1987_58327 [Smallanthus sonchifolius]|uniref:Uncharacterized protein n=1 Tax=Smallanthus sonchifolius TaxID=185202 RepID=A0ACB9DEZ7_9ASTR|nr:hypothetical protein L1987_58327 [Smallanthus sonchifolius]
MEKLKQLIHCNDIPSINHPAIIRERPQFQLLYDELDNPMIQTLFIDQHQDLEKVNDLKKRFTDAAEEAQYIVDLFLSGVHVRKNGRRSCKSVLVLFLYCFHIRNDGHFPTSLDLDDVRRSLESVKLEFMSMKLDSSRRPERTLDQSAAAHISISRRSKKSMDEIFVGLDDDLELIRSKLVEDQRKVDIVSIVEKEYDFKSLTFLEKLEIRGRFSTFGVRLLRRMKTTVLDGPKGCGKNRITFPATLKTLALYNSKLPWSDMSIIQSLPNLQVLRLHGKAFVGSCSWNTEGQEFPQLKFLRLKALDIKQWEAYSTSFPCLRQLEVIYCKVLEEIPLEIGEIPTLELIKIDGCRPSLEESARRIEEEQQNLGNYDLKIEISKPQWMNYV